jgi:hypothetical protein
MILILALGTYMHPKYIPPLVITIKLTLLGVIIAAYTHCLLV